MLFHSVRPIKVLHKIKLVVIVLWCHNLLWELSPTTLVYFHISCFVNIPRVPNAILSNFKSILSFMIIMSSRKFHYLCQWSHPKWTKSLFLSQNLLCNIYCHSRVYIFHSPFKRGFHPTDKQVLVIPIFMKRRSCLATNYRPTLISNNLSEVSECVTQDQLSFYFKFQLHPSWHGFTKPKPNTNN
jgi:hypothetical protein